MSHNISLNFLDSPYIHCETSCDPPPPPPPYKIISEPLSWFARYWNAPHPNLRSPVKGFIKQVIIRWEGGRAFLGKQLYRWFAYECKWYFKFEFLSTVWVGDIIIYVVLYGNEWKKKLSQMYALYGPFTKIFCTFVPPHIIPPLLTWSLCSLAYPRGTSCPSPLLKILDPCHWRDGLVGLPGHV